MDPRAARRPADGGGTAPAATVTRVLDRLREAGCRVTAPRRAVVEALVEAAGGHLTADELAARVRDRHPDIHRATVYRTLDVLQEAGVVSHVHLGHGPSTFHLGEHPHQHAVCSVCGAVVELPRDALDGVAGQLRADHGWELDRQHFALSAVCAACLRGHPPPSRLSPT